MDKIKKEQADDLRYMLPLNKAAKRALKVKKLKIFHPNK